jgi:hypothetical protein
MTANSLDGSQCRILLVEPGRTGKLVGNEHIRIPFIRSIWSFDDVDQRPLRGM